MLKAVVSLVLFALMIALLAFNYWWLVIVVLAGMTTVSLIDTIKNGNPTSWRNE